MGNKNPASPPDKPHGPEFDADAWVGEPDTRTYQEYQQVRFKLLLAIMLIAVGGMTLVVTLAVVASLALHLFS